jgi:hypothetical protein
MPSTFKNQHVFATVVEVPKVVLLAHIFIINNHTIRFTNS